MPIRSFKAMPRDLVEWGRFFQSTAILPDPDSVGEDELQDGSVTFEKIQAITPDRILGRDTSPAGEVQELTVSGGLEFTGSGIQRSELTGDVTSAAGSSVTAIADNVVGNGELRDSAACSVIGRAANSVGDPADIALSTSGHFLVRRGTTVQGDTILDADIPATIARDAEVTDAITALNLASGVYTPTVTGVTNVDAVTAYECQYLRVGSTVHVSGRVDVDATAAASTQVRISVPIASNFGAPADCAGTGSATAIAMSAGIFGDTANDAAMMEYIAADAANRAIWFVFSYQVI
jgi:hypothetical protein